MIRSHSRLGMPREFRPQNQNSKPRRSKHVLVSILSVALLFATCPVALPAFQGAQSGAPPAQARAPLTQDQLQQLVAPIALYPDSLVAQILAASTYPEQVVEADRWVQANPNVTGDALAQAVDQQNWDPSVKALCAFPSVLANMDKNISWTSSLGDAYYNQAQDVMDAIQVMRQKAQQAGNLQSTPQQTVQTQDRVRLSHFAVALLVSGPGNLVRRPLPLLRSRFRNRLLGRLRLGLGTLGI
jgi:Protein of unknown function (DUF3300)